MKEKSNIFLVGPLGAGKSTVGRQVARALECEFLDTDREVEARTGVDLAWIFDVEGEEGFRERETETLRELVKLSNIVLATGGGTVMRKENRDMLAANGIVIYLNTELINQIQRTGRNHHNRPMLRDVDLARRIQELADIRTPLYEEIADYTVITENRALHRAVKKILKLLESKNG